MEAQIEFSTQLKVLHYLPFGNRSAYEVPADDDGILNAIAGLLTTGRGDLYATAFDRRQGVRLILAKNGTVTVDDEQAAHKLVALVAAREDIELYGFFFARCRPRINKWIRKVHESMDSLIPILDQVRLREEELSIALPGFDDIRDSLYSSGSLPPLIEIISNLFHFIYSQSQDKLEIPDIMGHLDPKFKETHTNFKLFMNACRVMAKSTFFNHLVDQEVFYVDATNAFQQRAERVYQCQHHIEALISHQFENIPIVWANNADCVFQIGRSLQIPIKLEEAYVEVIRRILATKKVNLTDELTKIVEERLPGLQETWSDAFNVSLHPEVCIVLYFHQPSPEVAFDPNEMLPLYDPRQPWVGIGLGKRSCVGCTAWVEAYNITFRTKWRVFKCNGKHSIDCALPCLPGFEATNEKCIEQTSKDIAFRLHCVIPYNLRG